MPLPKQTRSDNLDKLTDRRRILHQALAGSLGALAWPSIASAQAMFPSQTIRIVVPFGPGGLADISTRLAGQKLAEKFAQPVLVDNRPGAGGVAAAGVISSAPSDGHHLILFSNGTAISTSLLKLPFDPQADFVPISSLAYFDLNLLVARDSKFTDLRALVVEGGRRQLTFGTINPGSTQHLSAELFKSVARLDATLIPFKTSGEVQLALQRGDIDVGFESYAALRGGIESGVLRALATTGPSRTAWLPNVPTVKEAGVSDYEVTGWNALYAPKGTPAPVVETIGKALREVIANPDMRKRLLDLGVEPRTSSSAEMADIFERDRRKWAQVIQLAKLKV
jgi:tripartite-type tricarboxylate transporter receptor subunit TctC